MLTEKHKYPYRIEPKTRVDRIYLTIATRILKNKYAPGEVLREATLANEFKVSRTPVREAMRRLQQENWVVMIPNIGFQVSFLDFNALKGLFATRAALDHLVLTEVIDTATDDELAEVQDNLKELIATDETDSEKIIDVTSKTFLSIWCLCDNSTLYEFLYSLEERMYRMWSYSLDNGAEVKKDVLVKAVSDIVDCLVSRDKSRIEKVEKNYLKYHKDTITESLF
jgi:DNA-binding GntR family transcriptional regulator